MKERAKEITESAKDGLASNLSRGTSSECQLVAIEA